MRVFVFILSISLIYSSSNFFYDEEDWYILKNPGQIQSITEDNYRVLFGTLNGIFTYDKMTEEFIYDLYLSSDLPSLNIKHIYFDNYSDYIWVVHDQGVSYKSLTSFSYRELSISDLIDYNLSIIDDIGSSPNYIWIRNGNNIVPVDSFSGRFVKLQEALDESKYINWGSSMYGDAGKNIDISKHYIPDPDWSIGYKIDNVDYSYRNYSVFFDKDGKQVVPTVVYEDSDNYYWIGTNRGFLFYSWKNTSKLNFLDPGLKDGIISDSYIDDDGNWWFFDSSYKRTGQYDINMIDYFTKEEDVFLTYWNEDEGIWRKFKTSESIEIITKDINDLETTDDYIFMGTVNGIFKHDINRLIHTNITPSPTSTAPGWSNKWERIDRSNGLNDDAVWKIEKNDERIFVATINGINEIDIESFSVVEGKFNALSKNQVYDIKIARDQVYYVCTESGEEHLKLTDCYGSCDGECSKKDVDYLFVASDIGILRVNLESDNILLLSEMISKQIDIVDNNLYCLSNTGVFKLNLINPKSKLKKIVSNGNVRNFKISGHYIWLNLVNRARLVDLNSNESWYYNHRDGIQGKNIFSIGCDRDWVWFMTREGISLYNWGEYHDNN